MAACFNPFLCLLLLFATLSEVELVGDQKPSTHPYSYNVLCVCVCVCVCVDAVSLLGKLRMHVEFVLLHTYV